jgi:hypothetical protein
MYRDAHALAFWTELIQIGPTPPRVSAAVRSSFCGLRIAGGGLFWMQYYHVCWAPIHQAVRPGTRGAHLVGCLGPAHDAFLFFPFSFFCCFSHFICFLKLKL